MLENAEQNQHTIPKGHISNISGTFEGIKLKLSGYVVQCLNL
jgi:hypothetical protein